MRMTPRSSEILRGVVPVRERLEFGLAPDLESREACLASECEASIDDLGK